MTRRAVPALLLAAAMAACDDPAAPPRGLHREQVVARVDDVLFAPAAPLAHSTADYPRRAVGDDSRVVLHPRMAAATAEEPGSGGWQEAARVRLQVPADAALELAYAAPAPSSAVGTAGIRIRLNDGGKDNTAFEETRPLSELSAWREVRVARLPEGEATMIVETTAPPHAPVVVAAPSLTGPATGAERPNILLVSLDTLRARQLSLYGGAQQASPRMEALFGKEGVVFDQVLSSGADTIAGHMAMLEGVNRCLVHEPKHKHSKAVRTLAEALRAAGYRTAAFTENGMLLGDDGFSRGFDRWFEDRRTDHSIGYIDDTFDRGIHWLRQNRNRRFFLFLHTYAVHNPYQPPSPYAERFAAPADADEAAQDLAAYSGEVAHADDQVQRLVAALRELGVENDTILIVTSDHGEEFGEHGRRYHGTNLTQEILHVPLLLRAPGRLPAGVRRTGLFGLIDVPPTILELAGLQPWPEMEGRSLAALIDAAPSVDGRRLYAEAWTRLAVTYGGYDESWRSPSVAITELPWRLVRLTGAGGPQYQLFHLRDDPMERTNLYEQRHAEVAALKAAADAYLADCARRQQEMEDALGRQDAPREPEPQEDADRREKLRALGYLD
ncbi:MAG TPA: sulfatase [Candidatus Limnocylindrales bacterium]|nr:sulfatase [Candidatus Limnocylindrales bacterium]